MCRTNYVLNVHPKLVNLSISWFHIEDMSSSNYKVYDSDFQEYRETYWDILTYPLKALNLPLFPKNMYQLLRLQNTANLIFHFSDYVCTFLITMKYSKKYTCRPYMKHIQQHVNCWFPVIKKICINPRTPSPF